ncbi:MAG TPA: NAD(P)/FAD-dependent oxidoreductase [Thermoanaerobaculia bacterium]|jgi:flavin-dependent dehydrogenase
MITHDVAVVGAGLAGLQCARLLASRGLRVLLIDRKPSLTTRVHTTGIFVRKTWEDFRLPDEQLGEAIRDVHLYSPAGRQMHLTASHDEFRVGRMGWLYLYLLEQCSRAGVQWMPSTRLVESEENAITVERNGHRARIGVSYVVGADGARSLVARLHGLDTNREMLVGVEDVVPPVSDRPALHCWLDPRLAPGYIGWVATDGEEAHVGVAGYRERFDPLTALSALRARVPFTLGKTIERRGGLIPVGGILRRLANKRALLVGDAAGAVSPLTAGGLDAALRLSTFAADVLVAHLGGNREALPQYTGDRFRARFLTRRWMRHALRAFENPLAMELACAFLRTPPMRAFAEHVFFSRGSFPDVQFVPAPGAAMRPVTPA